MTISSLHRHWLLVPKEVSYLAYVGFKLLAQLNNEQEVDWNATQNTVYDAVIHWNIIKGDVRNNKALYSLMNVMIDGLRDAQKSRNREMLMFGANVNMEIVDLPEEYYEKKAGTIN